MRDIQTPAKKDIPPTRTACKRGRNNEEESDFIHIIYDKFISHVHEAIWRLQRCAGNYWYDKSNLLNPIGILSVVLFLAGVWIPFHNESVNKILGAMGVIGIVVSEIYQFFTWHIATITGEMSLQNSLNLAYPEFYIGLAVSVLMIMAYFIIDKVMEE